MTLKYLQIPAFRGRKPVKPGFFGRREAAVPISPAVTLEFAGAQVHEFTTDILSQNKHFSAGQLTELQKAAKIVGSAKPDAALGKLIGAMYGRYWYVAG